MLEQQNKIVKKMRLLFDLLQINDIEIDEYGKGFKDHNSSLLD